MAKRLEWHFVTVSEIRHETGRVKSFVLNAPWLTKFRPGQHLDIRLTAPDGYQAQRSYSIASEPGRAGSLELTVELLTDGEVSPYFHHVARVGDSFEARGPIGGPFTWTERNGGPLLLVAGGSGVVPLMSMLRHRRGSGCGIPAVLLYSSRTYEDVIYRAELERMDREDPMFTFLPTLTRSVPVGWDGLAGRIDRSMIGQAVERLGTPRHAYVCGSNGFVEAATAALLSAGVDAGVIATERFGPTGS